MSAGRKRKPRSSASVRARDAEQKCKSMQKLVAQYADRQRELDDEIRGLEAKVAEAAKREDGLRDELQD